ncbi:MAG: hypothetical protein AAF918_08540 [Pseudomonadota bacterium]
MTATEYHEVVTPRESPKESRYVLLAVLGVLICATTLLLLRQRVPETEDELPPAVTALTTQLSNAEVELQLLVELGELSNTPDLDELVRAGVQPFNGSGVQQPVRGCIVFDRDPYIVRFRQVADASARWEVTWLDERAAPIVAEAMHGRPINVLVCRSTAEWLPL